MSDNKYKMFRNYMVNELGITRDDIKQWTKDAVAETVNKELHQINFKYIVEGETRKITHTLKQDISRKLSDRIFQNLTVKLEFDK